MNINVDLINPIITPNKIAETIKVEKEVYCFIKEKRSQFNSIINSFNNLGSSWAPSNRLKTSTAKVEPMVFSSSYSIGCKAL